MTTRYFKVIHKAGAFIDGIHYPAASDGGDEHLSIVPLELKKGGPVPLKNLLDSATETLEQVLAVRGRAKLEAVLAAENGECTLQMTLRQNAVVRFTLSARNQQGDYGYDYTWYQQHS